MRTPDEIARLVGAGIAAARGLERPANERRIHISRLKIENPGQIQREKHDRLQPMVGGPNGVPRFLPREHRQTENRLDQNPPNGDCLGVTPAPIPQATR